MTRFKSTRADISANYYVAKALRTVTEDEPGSVNSTVTALRFLVNCFRSDQLRAQLLGLLSGAEPAFTGIRDSFLASLQKLGTSTSKLVRSSLASFTLNVGVSLNPKKLPSFSESTKLDIYKVIFASVHNLLLTEKDSVDTIFRSCQMIGTAGSTDSTFIKAHMPEELAIIKGIIDAIKDHWRSKLGEKFECVNETLACI